MSFLIKVSIPVFKMLEKIKTTISSILNNNWGLLQSVLLLLLFIIIIIVKFIQSCTYIFNILLCITICSMYLIAYVGTYIRLYIILFNNSVGINNLNVVFMLISTVLLEKFCRPQKQFNVSVRYLDFSYKCAIMYALTLLQQLLFDIHQSVLVVHVCVYTE